MIDSVIMNIYIYIYSGGLYETSAVEKVINELDRMDEVASQYSKALPSSGSKDISVLTSQRLQDQ